MTDKEEKIISIRDNPLYNYDHVIEKLTHKEQPYITKIARRRQFPNGVYRLKKQLNERRGKLLDEHIVILNSKKVLWIQMTNEEAQQILGASNKPIFGTYLNDWRRYMSRHDMAFGNIPFIYIHEIEYVKKPVQTKLEI